MTKPKHVYFKLTTLCLAAFVISCSNAVSFDQVKVIDLPGATVPDAEIDANGNVHVAYLADNNIFYVTSTDGGESFNKPVRVNSEQGFAAGGLFRGPDLTIGKGQQVHIGWYNNANAQKRPRSEWGFMYSRQKADKTGFEPSRNLNRMPSDGFSLAADNDGNVAAIWVSDGLFASFSNDGGKTFDPPVKMPADPCECCGTRALYLQSGKLNYLYRDKENNDRDMYLGRTGDGIEPDFPLKLNAETWHINACPLSGNFLDHYQGKLLAAWELKGGIFFSLTGQQDKTLFPGEVRVTDDGKYPVVLGNVKGILVAWKEAERLKWQLFDFDGNQQTAVKTVKTSRNGRRPAGVALRNGRFLLFP